MIIRGVVLSPTLARNWHCALARGGAVSQTQTKRGKVKSREAYSDTLTDTVCGLRVRHACFIQAQNTTLHARQRPRQVASRLDSPRLLDLAHHISRDVFILSL